MNEIGIMTFHAAHNYGSVLQAYAAQELINELGYSCEIINYRLKNQRLFYNHFYTAKFGLRELILRLMRLPEHKKRAERRKKFEGFIENELKLTENEYRSFNDLKNASFGYKILMSGSDQVWNIHCRAEFKTEPPDSILGYYLAFGGEDVKRIAYSSSLGNMKKEEVLKYLPYLKKYSEISVREADGADMISEITGKKAVNTLDPTLMLNSSEWSRLAEGGGEKEKYIFIYTLRVQHHAKEIMEKVGCLGKKTGLKVKCSAPFSSVHVSGIEYHPELGPKEFLSYINKAALVITDSFHGTAFSLNFERPFYMVQMGHDKRKEQLLTRLGLKDRILHSFEEISSINEYGCDFSKTRKLLKAEREKTRVFLDNALRAGLEDAEKR